MKYIGEDNFNHLLQALKPHYDVSIDRTCSISLKWNYDKKTLDMSMQGYVQKQLTQYNHSPPKKSQHCPWEPQPKKYGKQAQDLPPPDDSPPLDDKGKKLIQQITGRFLHYCRVTDPTIPHALSEPAAQQANAMEQSSNGVANFLTTWQCIRMQKSGTMLLTWC